MTTRSEGRASGMPLAEARDLSRLVPTRPLTPSPPAFSGTLDELWDRFIVPNLPDPDVVADFHRELVAYLRNPDVLFLVRKVREMKRGREYEGADGVRLKATDNAPAWWTHFALQQGCRIAPGAFARVVETMPGHLFEVRRTMPTSASEAGWHIAHLFAVKDRRTDFPTWCRKDAIGYFVRNVHPCNYSLVPKHEWRRWGGEPRVIAFFVSRFERRYAEIWTEFLELARVDCTTVVRMEQPIRYSYAANPEAAPMVGRHRGVPPHSTLLVRASYSATRLLFKRNVIEALEPDDAFRIVTPHGTFEFAKAEFDRVFANVRKSASYRVRGMYHYPRIPHAALPFLVSGPETSAK